jgi:hypothetical protein
VTVALVKAATKLEMKALGPEREESRYTEINVILTNDDEPPQSDRTIVIGPDEDDDAPSN